MQDEVSAVRVLFELFGFLLGPSGFSLSHFFISYMGLRAWFRADVFCRPFGAAELFLSAPTACAVGYILAPHRGLVVLSHPGDPSPCREHGSVRDYGSVGCSPPKFDSFKHEGR